MVAVAGCAPTFAPPARVAIGVMPELPARGSGQVRLHGGGQGSMALRMESGLASETSIDLGISGAVAQGGMALAGAGLRRALYKTVSAAVVGSGGVGVGCGGKQEGVGSCGSRFAWAGYIGLDLGYRPLDWLGLYQGSRVQWSLGDRGGPLTFWQVHAIGAQLDHGIAFLTLEGGLVRFDSVSPRDLRELDSGQGPHLSAGLGLRW